MSARAPFVPKKNEPTNFSADTGNPLHSDSARTHATGHVQRSVIDEFGRPDSLNDPALMYRKENTRTSGLAGVFKRHQQAEVAATITRPGTAAPTRAADPYAHIVAPLPRCPSVVDPVLTLGSSDHDYHFNRSYPQNMRTSTISGNVTDTPPDPDYFKCDPNTHIASSERNNRYAYAKITAADNKNERQSGHTKTSTTYSRFVSPTGPQRIVNAPHITQDRQPFQDEESPPHNVNKPVSNPKKRQLADRDDEDIHRQQPNGKRYKAAEKTPEKEFSPAGDAERSSSVSRHTHITGNDGHEPGRQNHIDTEEVMSASYEYHLLKEPFTAKPAVEGTLNFDFDKAAAMSQDIMEQDVPRWTNCTHEEWNADGDNITEEYLKIISEMTEAHMDLLKATLAISATGDAHAREADRRKETLINIRRRITEASSNVFSG